jgi:hypothetical protein
MRKALILFLAITLAAITANAQKPFPRGVMVVLPVDDPNLTTEACWSDPNIIGVLLRASWNKVQYKGQSDFNWSFFNTGISMAQQNNKFVVLSISAVTPPSWVTVPIWSSNGQTCPYPWDANLQSYWQALVTSMGSNFDSVSCVHGVDMWAGGSGGSGATGITCYFAGDNAACKALDTIATGLGITGPNPGNTLWTSACESLCSMYLSSFPTTPLYLTPGTNYSELDPQSMTEIATWWLNSYPAGNSLFFNIFVNDQEPAPGGYWPNTTLNVSSITNGMFQTAGPLCTSDDCTGPMGTETLAQVLNDVITINTTQSPAGAPPGPYVTAVQIYPTDPATETYEASIKKFNLSVGL